MTPEEKALLESLRAEVAGLKATNAQLVADKNTAVAEANELRLTPIAREAATKALEGVKMPEVTRRGVIEACAASPITKEDGTLDGEKFTASVKEAATKALSYLAEATGKPYAGTTSPVRGAGSAGEIVVEAAKPKTGSKTVSAARAAIGL